MHIRGGHGHIARAQLDDGLPRGVRAGQVHEPVEEAHLLDAALGQQRDRVGLQGCGVERGCREYRLLFEGCVC